MEVRILAVLSDGPLEVRFTCSVGESTGVWRGDPPPDAGHSYDVELDVEDEPEWGRNLKLASHSGRLPDVLPGVIEEYDADGMVLRVGEGLVQLAPTGEAPTEATTGTAVHIVRPSITLWPTGI